MLTETITTNKLRWLERYLKSRISDSLLVEFDKFFKIYVKGSEKSILVRNIDQYMYGSFTNKKYFFSKLKVENDKIQKIKPLSLVQSKDSKFEPVIFNERNIIINYDFLGFIFWHLNRVEELTSLENDNHGRFLSTSSMSFKHNFLHKPVVDEWIELLKALVKFLWPGIKTSNPQFKISVSHDVDVISKYLDLKFYTLTKNFAGDLFKRRNLKLLFERFHSWQQVKKFGVTSDPYFNFNWLMDISEKYNLHSTFYLMAGCSDPRYDNEPYIELPFIKSLLPEILSRGHKIGLHPSYLTYLDKDRLISEKKLFEKVCKSVGLNSPISEVRMHYLRWKQSKTPSILVSSGLQRDSTLYFADAVGFRAGTCFEYEIYDVYKDCSSGLIEQPLVVMDDTIRSPLYMQAFKYNNLPGVLDIKNRCKEVNGIFSLLWHNNNLASDEDKLLYETIISN